MNFFINNLRLSLIKSIYSKWDNTNTQLNSGYTLLIPTPADLPVFLALALEIVSNQNHTDLKEIVIVPDWPSDAFVNYFKSYLHNILPIPIRFVNINKTDQLAWQFTKSITTRHFTQIVRGVETITTDYFLLHDSDLFLPPGDFLYQQYLSCTKNDYFVYGLDMRRSLTRFDRKEFVSTWETTFSTKWFKSFPPYMHKGQITNIKGIRQEFDTTLLPQYLSDEKHIGWQDRSNEYTHFNYVIASYRNFINKKRFLPEYSLKLLLIRLLVDVFDNTDWRYYELPDFEDFLNGKHGLLELMNDDIKGVKIISDFKTKINQIISSNTFSNEKLSLFKEKCDLFFLKLDSLHQ